MNMRDVGTSSGPPTRRDGTRTQPRYGVHMVYMVFMVCMYGALDVHAYGKSSI